MFCANKRKVVVKNLRKKLILPSLQEDKLLVSHSVNHTEIIGLCRKIGQMVVSNFFVATKLYCGYNVHWSEDCAC